MSLPKAWDEYEIKARYIPCLLAAVFPVHFAIQFLGNAFWATIAENIGWLVVTNLSLSVVVALALIQLQCGIAKHWIEENLFGKGGINFPTTTLLLFQDPFFSRKMKLAIREKIEKDFNLELMDETQEHSNVDEAKRLARDAVGLIRRYVGKGVMTIHYNIRYGFMRNLIGGVPWGLLGAIGCAILYGLQKEWQSFVVFIICSILFVFLFVFRKTILIKFAHQYAETLFTEYLAQKGAKK